MGQNAKLRAKLSSDLHSTSTFPYCSLLIYSGKAEVLGWYETSNEQLYLESTLQSE